MKKSLKLVGGVLAILLLVTGCTGLRVIDTDVTSFALWPGAAPAPGASYRFERLPSQQLLPARSLGMELPQDQLEALARDALAKVGLLNTPADAAFDVQVSASTRMTESSSSLNIRSESALLSTSVWVGPLPWADSMIPAL